VFSRRKLLHPHFYDRTCARKRAAPAPISAETSPSPPPDFTPSLVAQRLVRKWGGQAGWEMQKARHGLKERGQEVGIEHFNLDRIASNTMSSHRLVQWVTKTLGPTHSGPPHNPLLACLVNIRCDQLNQRHFPQAPSPELSNPQTSAIPTRRGSVRPAEPAALCGGEEAERPPDARGGSKHCVRNRHGAGHGLSRERGGILLMSQPSTLRGDCAC